MANSSQTQKAGDNASQTQIDKQINYYISGVSEERVREICKEQFQILRAEYSKEAEQTAANRVEALENAMIPRLKQIDDKFRFLTDPAFQFLLRDAQRVAASTDKKEDYDLLSELLGAHVQNGGDRTKKAGISHAIKIVGDVDSRALCALTILFFITNYSIRLTNLDDLLRSFCLTLNPFMYSELPDGEAWIEHLDLLGAIRIQQFQKFLNTREAFSTTFNGIICTGIKENSEEFKKALDILSSENISTTMLVDNELLGGYVRLNFVRKSDIDTTMFVRDNIPRIDNKPCVDACKKVWALYSKDEVLKKRVGENFIKRWDEIECLKKFRIWLDKVPCLFKITEIGDALARSNAMRCCPHLKPLLEK